MYICILMLPHMNNHMKLFNNIALLPGGLDQKLASVFNLPEICRPYNSNYVSSPHAVSLMRNTAHQWRKNKPKPLNIGVCTVLWAI